MIREINVSIHKIHNTTVLDFEKNVGFVCGKGIHFGRIPCRECPFYVYEREMLNVRNACSTRNIGYSLKCRTSKMVAIFIKHGRSRPRGIWCIIGSRQSRHVQFCR